MGVAGRAVWGTARPFILPGLNLRTRFSRTFVP